MWLLLIYSIQTFTVVAVSVSMSCSGCPCFIGIIIDFHTRSSTLGFYSVTSLLILKLSYPYWRENNFKKGDVGVIFVFPSGGCFNFVFIFQSLVYTLSDSELLWKCITISLPYLFFRKWWDLRTSCWINQEKKPNIAWKMLLTHI